MINPEDFYSQTDVPSGSGRKKMWQTIRREAGTPQNVMLFVTDVRSFLYGMAATLVLGLASVGAWSLARQAFENSQPEPLRVEQAYRSAIREFEQVVPMVAVSKTQPPQTAGRLLERKEQLKLVDSAIGELRLQTDGTDLSPLKRERLRQLYSMKLQILQRMIEEGEIEL